MKSRENGDNVRVRRYSIGNEFIPGKEIVTEDRGAGVKSQVLEKIDAHTCWIR